MIVIFFLNLYIFATIKKLNLSKKTRYVFLLGLIIETILLVIYRINLFSLGREVYFSDAETYWNDTLQLLSHKQTNGYNSLYYNICYLVQLTSPFIWVGWNNIFNLTCLNLSITLIIRQLKKADKETDEKNLRFFIILTMANPFIIYGLMRNLKDALFLFMTILVCSLAEKYTESTKTSKKIYLILCLLLITYLFTLIRPWGFIIPIAAIFYVIFKNTFSKKNKKIILLSIGLILAIFSMTIIFIPAILNDLKLWVPIVFSSLFKRNPMLTMLGIGKFLLAPGPIRSFLGDQYFEHYLITGNIMSGIGEIIWWGSIFFMLASISTKQKVNQNDTKTFEHILLFTTLSYLFIYIIQYGGTGELRLKSTFYIYLYTLFFSYYKIKLEKRYKKRYILLIALLTIIFTTTTIIGLSK